MKDSKVDNIIRNFLTISEGTSVSPSVKSRFLALEELLSKVEGKNLTEFRKLEIIKEQLNTIRKEVKKIEEKNLMLETENKELHEKLTLLEESNNKLEEMSTVSGGNVAVPATKPIKNNKKIIRVKQNAK